MKIPVLTTDSSDVLHVCQGKLAIYPDKYICLVIAAKDGIAKELVDYYGHWLTKAACVYITDNPEQIPFLNIVSHILHKEGMDYFFWGYEITGCIIIENIHRPCIESFGNICINKYGDTMTVKLLPDNIRIGTIQIKEDEDTQVHVPDWDEKVHNPHNGEKGSDEHDSTSGGDQYNMTVNSFDRLIRSIFSNPIVIKVGSILLWLLIAVFSYFIFIQLLN